MATTPTRKTRRVFRAVVMNDNDIEIDRSLMTEIYDKGGRRRWSHTDDGRSEHTVLDKLTIAEAGELLRSLADAIAFIAVEEAKRANATEETTS